MIQESVKIRREHIEDIMNQELQKEELQKEFKQNERINKKVKIELENMRDLYETHQNIF